MVMMGVCVGQIIVLVETSDPSAVRLSLTEADAYLTPLAIWGHGRTVRRMRARFARACPTPRWRTKWQVRARATSCSASDRELGRHV